MIEILIDQEYPFGEVKAVSLNYLHFWNVFLKVVSIKKSKIVTNAKITEFVVETSEMHCLLI